MRQSRMFCPFEMDYFPGSEFRIIGGTKVHDVDPAHRATDGLLVTIDKDVVIPSVEEIAAPETLIDGISSAIPAAEAEPA